MKNIAGIILFLLLSGCALFYHTGDNLSNNPSLEYRCDGIRPECLNVGESGNGNCLRAGGVWISESISVSVRKIEKLGGVFFNREKDGTGAGNVTYTLQKEDKTHKASYIVLYYKYGKTAGVKFTGDKTALDLSFSSIRLGDSEETVAKVMCKPRKVEAIKEINGYLWDYYPVQIGIEFKNGKVYSIKIGDCGKK